MGGRDPHGYGRLELTTGRLERRRPRSGQAEVKVGLIDSGVTHTGGKVHEFLAGHLEYNAPDVEPENEVTGHGSFVAGIVLGEAPTAKIFMRRAVTDEPGDEEDKRVAAAITELGAEVELINLSFGGSVSERFAPNEIHRALEALPSKVVVVAAVANNASPLMTYPAAHERVVSVGAATDLGAIAEFSGFGKWIRLYAPGVEVTGPIGAAGFATWSGTSLAAAVFTGQIADVMSFGKTAREALVQVLARCGNGHVWDVNGPRDVDVLPPALHLDLDLPIEL